MLRFFKPVLTGSGRMVTDGVYRHGAEMVALWFQHVMLLKRLRAMYLRTLRPVWRDRRSEMQSAQ